METKTQLAKLGLFDAKVPRYTSYPTAPHFSNDVGADHFTDWVRAIAPGASISLYIHVPFCRRLCWFCACRTQGTQSDRPVQAYLETLKSELALLKQALPQGVTLNRLHWGGGTPTLVGPFHDAGSGRHDIRCRPAWAKTPNSRSKSTPTKSMKRGLMRWPRRA